MGVQVRLNGMMFYFSDVDDLIELLDQNCDYEEETKASNGIIYDDEDI